MRSGDFMQGVEFSHWLMKNYIKEGDKVIDATSGNGHDTVFLADLVGKEGYVWAFDIQKEAIANTKEQIVEKKYQDRVKIIKDNHKNVKKYIESSVSGILFNLGYLPRGDKNKPTTAADTLQAVKKGIELLKTGGILVLVCYTEHSGGKEEFNTVHNYLKELKQDEFNVLHYHFLNQLKTPPQVLGAIKRS
ncbi:MAG: class I SAM-dependent methyltransferase [Halothermotrichaceae bacterium]